MKKILSLLGAALLTVGCTEDFKDWANPQTNAQEEPKTVTVTVGSIPETIDLATVTGETVQVFIPNVQVSDESVTEYNVMASNEDNSTEFELTADAQGFVTVDELQDAVVTLYNANPNIERTVKLIITSFTKVGSQSIKYVSTATVKVKPIAPQISQNYYIVGGPNDWSESAKNKSLKFNHSGKDVYEDPVFTVVFPASSGDTWFAIGDDEACEAIANDNDWSKLLGTTKGNGNTDPEGNLDNRYNLSDDGSFCVPAGAKFIKVTINMMDRAYKIEAVNISEHYYLVGGPNDWKESAVNKMLKFNHSNLSVVDDPVFTITFSAAAEGDTWFAFGDDEACEAIANDTWNKLFGTKGDSQDLKGTFDFRYNLDGDHSFCVKAGSGKFIRMKINMITFEYEITPLDYEEFIYVPGNAQKYNTSAEGMPEWGWTPELAPALRSANFDGKYEGFAYMDGEFKFTKKRNWSDGEYNYDSFSSYDDIFTGNPGTGGNINCTTSGYYKLVADVAAGSLTATKLTWGLVGPATPGGWDAGQYTVMTYNMADDCWEITTDLAADQFKFTTNGSWDINLGGTLDNLSEGGDNLSIAEAGKYTIKLYPSRSQSDKMYATVTKQ
jgi:hypothetical protein